MTETEACDCGASARGGHCYLCHEAVPSHDLLGHLRVMHPDIYGNGPEKWSDGGYVIYVDPSPSDFGVQSDP